MQTRRFGGHVLAASSPQGRFEKGAARLDGRMLDGVDAYGKHLFYSWEGGEILHVHLGLFGRFRVFATDPPPPTPGTRLALTAATGTLYLAGATIVSLVTPAERDEVLARLGPDPLRVGAGGEAAFSRALTRRSVPVGAALLDQRAVAGIGNVYRSELLFLAGIDPRRRARDLEDEEKALIWAETVAQLRSGERSGRIVTVAPAEVGAPSRRAMKRHQRLYAYKREGRACRRCGTAIARTELAGRSIWWCPSCQG